MDEMNAGVGLDVTAFKKGVLELKNQMKQIETSFRASAAVMDDWSGNTQGLTQRVESLRQKLDLQREALNRLHKEYDLLSNSEGNHTKEQKSLADQMYKMEGQIKRTESELKKFDGQLKSHTSGWEQLREKMDGVQKTFKSVGDKFTSAGKTLTATVTAPIVGAGVAAMKMGDDFEAQMSRVAAVSGATGDGFQALNNQALQLGADTAFSATEAAEGMENLASAGFSTNEIMAAMPGMLDLAASSGEDLATSSDIAASTLRGFGLAAGDAGHVADVLAKNAAQTNAAVADTGEAMKYIAPVAQNAGWSLEQVTAAIGEMSDAGIKGEQAGTTLRGALTNLMDPSNEQAKAMQRIGFSAYDANGKMKSLSQIVGELSQKTSKMTAQQRDQVIATIMGTNSLSGMQVLLKDGKGNLDNLTESLKNSDGASKNMAATMQGNTKGAIEQMKGSVETAAIKVQESLAPAIKNVADKVKELADRFSQLSPEEQNQILKIAGIVAVIGPLLLIFGKLATGISAIAGLIGTFSGAMALAHGVTVTATGAAITATPAMTALAGAIGAISGPVLIAVGAIAALTVGGIALYHHLKQSSIPAVQLFGKETSASTKKAVGAYMDLDNKTKKSLMSFEFSNKAMSKQAADAIAKNFDNMGNKIKTGMQQHFNSTSLTMKTFFAKSKALSATDEQQILQNMKVSETKKENTVTIGTAKIKSILQKASKEKRALTKDEQQQINSIQENMKTQAVTNLSSTELESKSILERMKAQAGNLTARQAADVVANAKTQKDKAVAQANDQYDKTVQAIIQQRDGAHTISADQANKLIADAKRQRDGQVNNANDSYSQVVSAAKKQSGGHVKEVDWETGQVKSKWQVMKDDVGAKAKGTWDNVKSAFGNAKNGVVGKVGEICLGIKNKWNETKNKAWSWGNDLMMNIKNGMLAAKKAVQGAADTAGKWIKERLGHSVPTEGPLADELNWMPDMMENFANGILSNKYRAIDAISNVADGIRSILHFSVPDEGPLSDADTYGLDFMQLLADTIDKNSDKPKEATKRVAELVSQETQKIKDNLAASLKSLNAQLDALNSAETVALRGTSGSQRYAIQDEYNAKEKSVKDQIALRKEQADKEIAEIKRIGQASKDELQQEIDDRKVFISSVNSLVDELKNDLKKKYDEEEKAQEDALNKRLDKLETWKTESENAINEVYSEKIKKAEDAADAATVALQAELDALDVQKSADDREAGHKEYEGKISDLQSQIAYSHDDYNKAQLEKQLAQEKAAYQKQLDAEALEDKKADLNNQIAAIKANLDQQKAALQAEQQAELDHITKIYNARKTSLDNQLQKVKDTYSKMTEDARLEAEAEQLIMQNNQNEILALLNSYSDAYKLSGQTLGDKLAEGFQPAIDRIKSMISSIDDAISDARNSALDALEKAQEAKEASRSASRSTTNNSRVNDINVSIYSPTAQSPSQQARQATAAVQRALFQVG